MVEKKKSYDKCLDYIEKYWKKITVYSPEDKGIHMGLPNAFIEPNRHFFKGDQFYWDSYFTILGLLESRKINLAKGMVDNFVYLYKRFGFIPSRNRFYCLAISQLPFLTSMAMEVFKFTKDKSWFKEIIEIAERELKDYWMSKKGAWQHISYMGLSRYSDQFVTHFTAENESGWEITTRFDNHCLDYLPIDLNCCLYKYEIDLSKIYKMFGNKTKEKDYFKKAEERKKKIMDLMWDEKTGFFFDYNHEKGYRGRFFSLAGFYPLWVKISSKKQAEMMVGNMKVFEYKGGLASTQKNNLRKGLRQWDYPNGWANQHWIVIKGLLNYGFDEDAKRIAKKWLDLNKKIFLKTGKFWEKYDVVNLKIGKHGLYPTQSGFGWTNAIFVKLVKTFDF